MNFFMNHFATYKLVFLLKTFIFIVVTIPLEGEDYNNVISKENLFNIKNILPIDEAFKFEAQVKDKKILLVWKINESCYMYRDKFKIFSKGNALNINLPRGNKINDQFFGEMEVFYNSFNLEIDKENLNDLEVEYQGCHKKGYCYIPVKKSINISP